LSEFRLPLPSISLVPCSGREVDSGDTDPSTVTVLIDNWIHANVHICRYSCVDKGHLHMETVLATVPNSRINSWESWLFLTCRKINSQARNTEQSSIAVDYVN
jgi:hypothetical protein